MPYRNSLMTLVLRDSLGGNCRTVMVATISGEAQHVEESISTCRFAQRVALVKNEARATHTPQHAAHAAAGCSWRGAACLPACMHERSSNCSPTAAACRRCTLRAC